MEGLKFPVAFATVYLFIFLLARFLDPSGNLVVWLFLFAPIMMVWLVIRVLKDGKPSEKKWSDGHFYEDVDVREGN
ncbi:MAG: hypothetical protein AAFX87_15210 [Bacteroidota bacterium]